MEAPPELAAALVPAVVRPTFSRLPISMVLSDGRLARVHFDRGTHTSRRMRALTQCSLHPRCRIDKFMDSFCSETRCIAWMFAWHEAGAAFAGDDAATEHRLAVVPAAAIDAWEEKVQGH